MRSYMTHHQGMIMIALAIGGKSRLLAVALPRRAKYFFFEVWKCFLQEQLPSMPQFLSLLVP